jgi:hypothetical protein
MDALGKSVAIYALAVPSPPYPGTRSSAERLLNRITEIQ